MGALMGAEVWKLIDANQKLHGFLHVTIRYAQKIPSTCRFGGVVCFAASPVHTRPLAAADEYLDRRVDRGPDGDDGEDP